MPVFETGDAGGSLQGGRRTWSVGRVLFLAFTGFFLYLFAPSITEVFEAWGRLGELDPRWLPVVLALGVLSFACMWLVQAVALDSDDWFSIVTTQLAGNAFNRITPGGGATGTALQAAMLSDAGFDTTRAATALTVQSLLSTASVIALPVLAVPEIILGTQVPAGLLGALYVGAPVFILMAGVGVVFFTTNKPLCWLGRFVEWSRAKLKRRSSAPPGAPDLPSRLLQARNEIRATIGDRWLIALGGSLGRWIFEFGVLLVTLIGIGATPDPALVVLAFVGAAALGLLPFTPGGLGFVEAGLTATLALAGVDAGAAVLATLVYRLVTFWLPLPVGAVAAFVFRRKYPKRRNHTEHVTRVEHQHPITDAGAIEQSGG